MSDGNEKAISALAFTPAAKVYAYQYENATGKLYWKIIKIADGDADLPAITATPSAGAAEITTYGGTTTTTLTDIIGAAPKLTATKADATDNLKFTDNGDWTYRIAVKDKAIADGTANGTYTLKYNGSGTNTVKVALPYMYKNNASTPTELAKTDGKYTTAVAQGGSVTVNLTAGGSAVPEGAKIVTADGLTIEEISKGKYTITASRTATGGNKSVYIAGQELVVVVTAYAFDASSYVYTVDKTDASAISESTTITLNAITSTTTASSIAADDVTKSAGLTMTGTGTYTPTSTAGGVYNISYQGTSATVTINEYDLNVASGNSATFNHETGSTKLTLKLNGKEIIPDKAKFTIENGSGTNVTANFTISIVGKNITIAPKSGQIAASTSLVAKYTVNNAAASPTVVAKIDLTAQ
jgi:thiamine phosphate synthase YjbQ (UPF0047 family)